jgi:hypothetical protein
MVYCLKIQNSNEYKVCIDADDKKSAINYFCKFEHLSKEKLTKLFKIVPKKSPPQKK